MLSADWLALENVGDVAGFRGPAAEHLDVRPGVDADRRARLTSPGLAAVSTVAIGVGPDLT